jgi:hypothetical protein
MSDFILTRILHLSKVEEKKKTRFLSRKMNPVSKAEKEKLKLIQDKCQGILNDLLKDEDNKYCEDCDAKGKKS